MTMMMSKGNRFEEDSEDLATLDNQVCELSPYLYMYNNYSPEEYAWCKGKTSHSTHQAK